MSIDKLVEAVKEFEKNIPKDFETQFREWWDLVWENHLELDSSEFDFIDAINNFLENPKGCWLAEKQYRESIRNRLFEKRLLRSAQKHLRDLRRNAFIDIRIGN